MITSPLRDFVIRKLRTAFPNHEDVLTDGLGTLIVYFAYFSIAIMIIPLLLTCKGISFINFTESGPIGDTIGGIMGPFIALLAAFLTFMAFWIQYRANNLQRDIAERQLRMAEQQNKMMARQTEIAEKQERKYVACSTIKIRDLHMGIYCPIQTRQEHPVELPFV